MFPVADSSPDKRHAFYSALYEQSGQWLKERPNCLMFFWAYRFDGIEILDDLPAARSKGTSTRCSKLLCKMPGLKFRVPTLLPAAEAF